MIKSRKTLALLGFAALASLALAQGMVMKMTPKVGDTHKYKLNATFSVNGADATVSGDVTEKISKVEPNGDFTVERSQGALTIDLGGQTIPMDAGSPKFGVYHPDGSIIELRGEGIEASYYRMEALTGIRFPATPLKVGDTWKIEIPADTKTGVLKTTANYKVLGEEKVGAINTWKISQSTKENEGDTPGSTESTVWLDKSDLSLVKSEGTWTNVPVPQAPAPVSGKNSLTLVQK